MSSPTSPQHFQQEFTALIQLVKSPDASPRQIKTTFARLSRRLRQTKFPQAAARVQAGQALGTLRLLWLIRPEVAPAHRLLAA